MDSYSDEKETNRIIMLCGTVKEVNEMNAARKTYDWIKKNVLGVDLRSQLEIAVENGLFP